MTGNPGARLRHALGGSLLATALTLPGGTASAVRACMNFDTMSDQLERRYAEVPVASGLTQDKLLQVFATSDGSTWTVVLTRPDGMSCVVATGHDWQPIMLMRPHA